MLPNVQSNLFWHSSDPLTCVLTLNTREIRTSFFTSPSQEAAVNNEVAPQPPLLQTSPKSLATPYRIFLSALSPPSSLFSGCIHETQYPSQIVGPRTAHSAHRKTLQSLNFCTQKSPCLLITANRTSDNHSSCFLLHCTSALMSHCREAALLTQDYSENPSWLLIPWCLLIGDSLYTLGTM